MVLDFACDQTRRGLQVAVASPDDHDLTMSLADCGVRHVPWQAKRSPGISVLSETRSLKRLIAELQPQVLHLHSSKAGLTGRLGLRGRIPTVFQPHGWSFFAVDGPIRTATLTWERLSCRWADVILCVSAAERDTGLEMGLNANWEVVQNGVDLNVWTAPKTQDREAARAELELPVDATLVVCVGRLQRQKGQDLLLKAWPEVAARFPKSRLVLVGDGPDRESLEQNAGERVTFVGQRSDVREWMVAADLIVMPSRWEGLSLAMLEAMACSRAIIASDVTGMKEAAGDDGAFVIPPDRVEDLKQAMMQLLETPEEREALGLRARSRVEQHFALSNTCEQVLKVYSQISSIGTATRSHATSQVDHSAARESSR